MRKLIIVLLLSLPFAAMAQVDLKSRWIVNLNGFRFSVHNGTDSILRVRTDSILFGKPTNLGFASQSALNDSIASLQAQINSLYDSLAAAPSLVFDSADFTIVDDTVRLNEHEQYIDLTTLDFNITQPGNYKVIAVAAGVIFFPDPLLFTGKDIIIWNIAADAIASGSYIPVDISGSDDANVRLNTITTYKSMFGKWVIINVEK